MLCKRFIKYYVSDCTRELLDLIRRQKLELVLLNLGFFNKNYQGAKLILQKLKNGVKMFLNPGFLSLERLHASLGADGERMKLLIKDTLIQV